LGSGRKLVGAGKRPEQLLTVYEYEACPYCRKAREALSALALDYKCCPTPRGGTLYRDEVQRLGGQAMFPFLIDPNTGTEMYESDDIVHYLYKFYGQGTPPLPLRLGPLTMLTSNLSTLLHPAGGFQHGRLKENIDLELFGREGNAGTRIVRALLCRLEQSYVMRCLPVGSSEKMLESMTVGSNNVPVLWDKTHNKTVQGAREIVGYLEGYIVS